MGSGAPARRLVLVVAPVLLGIGVLGVVRAQGGGLDVEYGFGSARVEVRVWQSVADGRDIHVSARPAAGSWGTLGTARLLLDDGVSSSGRYRYGDIALNVEVRNRPSPVTVEVRVWQEVGDDGNIHVSARPAEGSWAVLGTIPLPLDKGLDSSLQYRFGDIGLDVPLFGEGVLSLAGKAGVRGFRDGQGDEARFGRSPETALSLSVDRDGSVVVADFRNAAIRRILPDGTVTTVAGGRGFGSRDGPADEAQFEGPTDVAIDSEGAIYVADCRGHRIRRIAPDGMVTTVAGGEQPEEGRWLRRDGPGDQALLVAPCEIAIAANGDLYVSEQYTIRRISPSGWVSTFAGSGLGYRDGPREDAQFYILRAIGLDARGNVYVLDRNRVPGTSRTRYAVRKIDTTGSVSPVFWSDAPTVGGRLVSPAGMAVSPEGEVYLTNTGRHQIVKVLGLNELQAVAGTGEDGHLDGAPAEAVFSEPGALAFSPGGALVVMDQADSVVRVVLPQADGSFPAVRPAEEPRIPRLEGVAVDVFAGRGVVRVTDIDRPTLDGQADEALFLGPEGMAFAPDGSVIVADTDYHAIRRISPSGVVSTVAGGNGPGLRDGGPEEAQFSEPHAVAVNGDGTIYVADTGNAIIRKVTPDGEVETVEMRGGPFYSIEELALDGQGNVLFTEQSHGAIRRLAASGAVSSAVGRDTTSMYGLAVSDEGVLFFATHRRATSIRKLGPDGVVSTVFKDIPSHYGGVFSGVVTGLAVAPDGTLYASDWGYGRVVRLSPDEEAAIVVERSSFDHADITEFGIQPSPSAILITPEGDLLVADASLSVIWRITLNGEGGNE